MKTKAELQKLGDKDFSKELMKARKEVMKLRFEAKTGQLAGTHKLSNARKYVARMLTAQTEMKKNQPVTTSKYEK